MIDISLEDSDIDFYVPIRDNEITTIDHSGHSKTKMEDFILYPQHCIYLSTVH